MLAAARQRYLDLLASVYIYNEHRGYSSLDRVLVALRAKYPDDRGFIAEVEKHRADERKHYLMFKRWFEARGEMPYLVDRACGQIDRMIRLTFGCHIDDLDTQDVIDRDDLFAKLCRVIMLTEVRGMRQVDILLAHPAVKADKGLMKIFHVVERDEPSHWMPYEAWIRRSGRPMPYLSEKVADILVHRSLVLAKLPSLYLHPRLKRRTDWPDDHDAPREKAAASVH
ncbi:MAG: ferritin-like domain-containing protein [Allosphingosinicella sp.]